MWVQRKTVTALDVVYALKRSGLFCMVSAPKLSVSRVLSIASLPSELFWPGPLYSGFVTRCDMTESDHARSNIQKQNLYSNVVREPGMQSLMVTGEA